MRFPPSRQYLTIGITCALLAVVASLFASEWTIALVSAILFLITATVVLVLALRPAIEIRLEHLMIGRRPIAWNDIVRVDRTGWISPLAVYLTLASRERVLILYAGDLDTSNALLRQLRRNARLARIDGIEWAEFWGETPQHAAARDKAAAPKGQVLNESDEADVERLFQMLKTVGHMDTRQNGEEK
jgi:hypothetical protein